jgi:hypothetical protein
MIVVMILMLAVAIALVDPAAGSPAVVRVSGPTIVAFFVDPQRAETDSDLVEVLADFRAHAEEARASLARAGVALEVVYPGYGEHREHIILVELDGKRTILRPKNVGYYFLAPGGKMRIETGFADSGALMEHARRHLGADVKVPK